MVKQSINIVLLLNGPFKKLFVYPGYLPRFPILYLQSSVISADISGVRIYRKYSFISTNRNLNSDNIPSKI